MEKIKYVLLIVLFSNTLFSQEETSPWKIASVELIPISYGAYGNGDAIEDAFQINGSIIFNKEKHYIKATALFGSQSTIGSLGGSIINEFYSIELLYGRKFKLGEKSALFTYLGGGFFSGEQLQLLESIPPGLGQVRENGFGVPIHISFEFGRRFVLGPQIYGNINEVGSVYTLGLLVKWNFK